VKLRLAAAGDVEGIEGIDGALELESYDRARVRQAIEEGRVVVAEDSPSSSLRASGEVVGYVRWGWFWEKLPYCMIARVTPSHQGRGIGRALYEMVEERLREAGYQFWLSSTEADNERSLAFHAALGFRRIGALSELGQEEDEVFLRKDWGS
jgi:L-amino acid N-acyltransferase YncA